MYEFHVFPFPLLFYIEFFVPPEDMLATLCHVIQWRCNDWALSMITLALIKNANGNLSDEKRLTPYLSWPSIPLLPWFIIENREIRSRTNERLVPFFTNPTPLPRSSKGVSLFIRWSGILGMIFVFVFTAETCFMSEVVRLHVCPPLLSFLIVLTERTHTQELCK